VHVHLDFIGVSSIGDSGSLYSTLVLSFEADACTGHAAQHVGCSRLVGLAAKVEAHSLPLNVLINMLTTYLGG
jgi:hypothetical protein